MSNSPPDTRRDLQSITRDGVAFSVMVGLGEAYVPAFALAAGLGEVVAALVATLPMLVGAVLQLVTPWAVRRLGSYRRWVVLCARAQALSFAPLLVGAALGRIDVVWLGAASIAYWAFGMATGPAWNAWVTSLVPREVRARFFARRTRSAHAALLAALLIGGVVLEWGRGAGRELACFGLLFAGAMIARLVSSGFLARQSEAPGLAASHRALSPGEIRASVRGTGAGRILVYLLGMHAAVNIAAPFFTPYMLGPLGLSYAEFMLLTAVSFLARVVVLPMLGRLAERRGTRAILWWGAIGIVPLPALWLVSQHFVYLLALQIYAGVAWAALEYASLMSFFERIEERDRTSVLAVFNLGTALAVGLGSLVGTQLFQLDFGPASYVWIFAASSCLRLLTLAVLRGTPPVETFHMELRTLAVRPSTGVVERPILASAERAGESDASPAELL